MPFVSKPPTRIWVWLFSGLVAALMIGMWLARGGGMAPAPARLGPALA